MSMHIQTTSHYPSYEAIKTTHSNLTKGSARSRRGAEVVEEGAKASQNIVVIVTSET